MAWRHRVARKVHQTKDGGDVTYGIVEEYDGYGTTAEFMRPQGDNLDWLIWELVKMLDAAVDAKKDRSLIVDGGEW